jgi:NAD(P)H-dependent FMN reductase
VIPIDPDVAKARATYVRDMMEKIKSLRSTGATHDALKEATGTFSTQYPGLFKMILEDSYNDASLRTMLALLDRMGTGQMSQHQASVVVGQRLHDIYIKPKMSNA